MADQSVSLGVTHRDRGMYVVRITRMRSVKVKTVTHGTEYRWGGEQSEKWHNHRSVGTQAQ